jgi:hypothetical protein
MSFRIATPNDPEIEAREQAPTVTRCALCANLVIHEGTFAEGRQAALEHRRRRHPEIRERVKRQRSRTFREQSKAVVRDGKITPEITAKAISLRSAGFSWASIAERYWEDLGYVSKTSCSTSIARSVERFERENARAAA